jgi:hypothetical protein
MRDTVMVISVIIRTGATVAIIMRDTIMEISETLRTAVIVATITTAVITATATDITADKIMRGLVRATQKV